MFANIREYDCPRIQNSRKTLRIYISKHNASQIEISANKFSLKKSRNKETAKIK